MKKIFATKSVLPLFISMAFLGGCSDTETVVEEKKAVVRPVQLLTVEKVSNQTSWTFPATVEAFKSTELAFQGGGKLIVLNAVEGQEVKQGDVLASVDKRDYEIQLRSATATYSQARNAYLRGKQLLKKEIVSDSQLEELESGFESAKAQLDSAKKALEDTTIYAPYDGAISKVNYKLFDTIGAGQPVISFIDGKKFNAVFDIPAEKLTKMKENQPDSIFVILNDTQRSKQLATFEEIALLPSASSQAYEMTMSFMPSENTIVLPGINVSVQINTLKSSNDSGVSVPTRAIISTGNEKYIWVVDPKDMLAEKRVVTVGNGIGENVTVTSGVNIGDVIITSGASYVIDGMKVSEWKKL